MSTETIDPRYVDIDQWPTIRAVEAMLEGQMAAIAAIGSQAKAIALASEAAAVPTAPVPTAATVLRGRRSDVAKHAGAHQKSCNGGPLHAFSGLCHE